MKVLWSPRALREWEIIARYIFREFERMAVERFETNILQWESRIAINPNLAQQEPLLKNRTKVYRSMVVNKHAKLIFYVEDDTIYIADLWDTRREPLLLSNQLK